MTAPLATVRRPIPRRVDGNPVGFPMPFGESAGINTEE